MFVLLGGGLPVTRYRKYIIGCKRSSRFQFPPVMREGTAVPLSRDGLLSVYGNTPSLTGREFFLNERPKDIVRMLRGEAGNAKLPERPPTGGEWQFHQVCCRNSRRNILVCKDHIDCGRYDCDTNFNIMQTFSFGNMTRYIPALLKQSIIYNFQERRPLTAVGHLEVQGIFVLGEPLIPSPCRELFLSDTLNTCKLKALAGNSFHKGALLMVVLLVFAALERPLRESNDISDSD